MSYKQKTLYRDLRYIRGTELVDYETQLLDKHPLAQL